MRVIFLGSADFGIPTLQMLHRKHTVAAIVSTPPRQKGRGLKMYNSPVVDFAQSASIAPVYLPESFDDCTFIRALQSLAVDCFVVVAFKILPRSVFSLPLFGTLNVHASLLPAYRGPAPIQRAIEAGEQKTGVTIFRIDDGIDTGEILQQREIVIGADESTPELYERLSKIGADALESALNILHEGHGQFISQKNIVGSKAPKLKKTEARISWKESAVAIFNKIRAFKPFPGTFTLFSGKRLEIEWAQPIASVETMAEYGTVICVAEDYFDVQTGSGGALRVLTVKPEGRKSMPVREFLHGTDLQEGYQFHE
jgi:methionyl-tRNA formyltransferase